MLERGDLITLNNNKEYIVLDEINFNHKDYLYLITKDGITDVLVCLREDDNLTIVREEELLRNLLDKFKERMVHYGL